MTNPGVLAKHEARERATEALQRYRDGEIGALTEAYRLIAPSLQRYLLRATRSRVLTEDLTQQTFMNVHHARASFRDGSDATAWVFAIAHRLLIDELRRGGALRHKGELTTDAYAQSLPAGGDDPEREVASRELARNLDAALASLPPTLRQAFELVRFDGLSMAEAAQRLSTTENAVKLRTHRADAALRAVVNEGSGNLPRVETSGRRRS